METSDRSQKISKMFMSFFADHLLRSDATEIQSQCTFVYVECSLLSNWCFARYLCVLSCPETVVETKHKCGPQGDQRFNLTRWDKPEKDFDFPLCFATRKADFFSPVLSLLEKAEIRPSPEKWAGVAIYKHVWLYYKPTEEKFEMVWKDLLNSFNVSSQILFTQTRADQGHSKTQPAQTFKARVILFFKFFFILSSLLTE